MQPVEHENDLSRTKDGVIVNRNQNQYNMRKFMKSQMDEIKSLKERINIIEELIKGKF